MSKSEQNLFSVWGKIAIQLASLQKKPMSNGTVLDEEVFTLLGDANAAILERDESQKSAVLVRLRDCARRANAADESAAETRLRLAIDKLATQLERLTNGREEGAHVSQPRATKRRNV